MGKRAQKRKKEELWMVRETGRLRKREKHAELVRVGGTEQSPRPQGGWRFPCPGGLLRAAMADVTSGSPSYKDHYGKDIIHQPQVQRISSKIHTHIQKNLLSSRKP